MIAPGSPLPSYGILVTWSPAEPNAGEQGDAFERALFLVRWAQSGGHAERCPEASHLYLQGDE